jgi:imidazoleglycerol phosphate synthase cyclase subunit
MLKTRVIPCLLLREGSLVKTIRFEDPHYVGDPINTVRIFNEMEVDEIVFLDIAATTAGRAPDYALIERLAGECFMPVAYGGGVRTLEQMRQLFRSGIEKIILNSAAAELPDLVSAAAAEFGSQSLVVSIDARSDGDGRWAACIRQGRTAIGRDVVAHAQAVAAAGAGEILLTSIDRDGTRKGYDLELVRAVSTAVGVPVIASGGAGVADDFGRAVREGGAAACAAGSLVVYAGANRAVLINFPSPEELDRVFERASAAAAPGAPVRVTARAAPTALPVGHRECTRCLYGTHNVPLINFDADGVCNYCRTLDTLAAEYPRGDAGWAILEKHAARIKHEQRGRKYDVAVGVSGGCDSSYMLVLAKQLGLRPLAVHFDNTWNSRIAVENIQRMLRALDVDLHTYVVDNEEYDDIYRAFLKSGTPDVEAPTDLGLAVVLNQACEQHGIRTIFEGHSYRTEGISPIGWLYMDGRYISSVHRRFGSRPMKTYPNMPLGKFLHWTVVQRLEKIRPLYYLDFQKEATKQMLHERYGWQWYGGHHLENRFTAFFHTYFWPRRWGIDGRLLGHCALVWAGQMTRAEAAAELAAPPVYDPGLVEFVKQRLRLTDAEFERVMTLPKKTYLDYPNYKRTFELLRPLFWLLYKANRVPKSFFLKYCHPYQGSVFRGHAPAWGQPVPAIQAALEPVPVSAE